MNEEKDPILNNVKNMFSHFYKIEDKQNKALNKYLNILFILLLILVATALLLKYFVF